MGAVLNTAGAAEIAAELACCACSSVCGFLCKDQATRAKLRYCTILLFATIMCFVMLVPGMRRSIDRIPNFCGKLVTSETCDRFFGFGAVYRIMLSMTSFYGIFALWTIRVTRTNSFRAKVHNGFWIAKLVILGGITAGTFFIPKKSEFFRIWMYACLVGGFVFMMYQIVMVIDFGHSWSVSWAEKLDSNSSKLWYLAMVLSTILMFVISLAAVATFYVFFAGSQAFKQCKANMFYITFVVIQCFLATVISVIPTVQQELEGAGLLQSSVVILYTVYLTFNTLSTEPDAICNPLGKVILDYDKMSGINGEALFGCLLTFALIIFACTVRAHTTHFGKYGLALSESEEYALTTFMKQQEKMPKDGEQPEISLDDFVGCNYSLFHFIMALASLHLLMILTNWHSPDQRSSMKRLVKNWASVWVQMASSFICILIYIWFLVTPLIRKLWGPLFGIPLNEDVYKRFNDQGHNIIVAKDKVAKDNVAKDSVGRDKVVKDNILKGRSNDKKEDGGTLEKYSNDVGDKFEPDISMGSIKRLKSMESLRSAVSSVTKRKSRLKHDGDGSRSQVNYSDQSNDKFVDNEKQHRTKRKGLTRFGSIESLRSGFSVISTATSEVREKIKRKLKRKKKEDKIRENEQCDDDSKVNINNVDETKGVRKENEGRVLKLKNSFVNSRKPGEERMRTIQDRLQRSYDSNWSDGKRKNRSRPVNNMEPLTQDVTSGKQLPERQLLGKQFQNEQTRNIENEQQLEHKTKTNDIAARELQTEIYSENRPAEQCAGTVNNKQERPLSSASYYGTSTFQEKAQDPQVAREMLRLQWKILRMQAKVVKIQEKIMRIQAEDEAAKKNAMEAAERLEPPLGQSSMVAGDVYMRNKEVEFEISRKEHG
ncbi:uncharacterized protein LOC135690298 [Rhopilema esculentum]|uniref:uncharacterized protein LOC135690298 n=1 Tax=Rhopilema esculentum TaxID=499914 RepID=UPI0031D9515D|eukprot:gene3635-14872_t